jgi:hypothetical protein
MTAVKQVTGRKTMRTNRLAPALLACAAALVCVPAALAQEEPPLVPETPAPKEAAPLAPTAPPPAPAPGTRLRPTLDLARWREMTARERQTFVEGAVMSLRYLTFQMRGALGPDDAVPPDRLEAMGRFVREYYPRFPAEDYLQEMERIYLTAEGQNLSMTECFLMAFKRINGR